MTIVSLLRLTFGLAACGVAGACLAKPDPQELRTRIHEIKSWLASPATGSHPSAMTVGESRSVTVLRDDDGKESAPETEHAIQTTAACKTLEFMARHAMRFGADEKTSADLIQRVDRLRSLQSVAVGKIHEGALASDRFGRNYVTFTNALCGDALLLTHGVLRDAETLAMASSIGVYLLRLLDTGAMLSVAQSKRTGLPPVHFGIFDRVNSAGRIQATSSTWNMTAAAFLDRLHRVSGDDAHRAASEQIRAFQLDGLRGGYDYFFPKFDTNIPNLILSWNLGYESSGSSKRHNFADGRWHRHGDIRTPRSGTVGTDQIEYALQALHAMRWNPDSLRDLYMKFRQLPPELGCLDSRVSFSGYFRIFDSQQDGRNASMGKYYDIVGAGILAELKRSLFPADHEKAVQAILKNKQDWAMVACDIEPIWTVKDGVGLAKRSTLVAATSGIALLDALASDSSTDQQSAPPPDKRQRGAEGRR